MMNRFGRRGAMSLLFTGVCGLGLAMNTAWSRQCTTCFWAGGTDAASAASEVRLPAPPVGRWDLTVGSGRGAYPSWLEVTQKDGKLAGRFVGRVGSVRPIKEIAFAEETQTLTFSLPPQYEGRKDDLRFTARLTTSARLEGTTTNPDGSEVTWTATPAPALKRSAETAWGTPITLFNGSDLTGWRGRFPNARHSWSVKEGVLTNSSGMDLRTEQTFTDFKLHAEFRLPKSGNSGIYLRGRYEVQIEDDYGKPADLRGTGSIYGFLLPRLNAVKAAGEWQTCDITLVGRQVTVVLNGETVLDRQEIPGITGGAIESKEGEPGPILLQGDHSPVEFRNLVLTPAKSL